MTARPRLPSTLGTPILVITALASVYAASPTFWRVSTQAELLQGDAENVSIDADGRLLLGPNAEVVYETAAPYLWTLVSADDALWLGSGNDGAVYRVEPDGTATTVLEGSTLDVHALAAGVSGQVYAGTSPDGAVLALRADGSTTEVFDPEEQYIWTLAAAPDGALFVGTGNPGRIYRVAPDGEVSLFYDTEATHVRSLAIDGAGLVVAGTGSPGQVFRIDADRRAFVLLDSAFDEITSLRIVDDRIYAVAASGNGEPAPAPEPENGAAPIASVTATTVTASADAGGRATGAASGPSIGSKGAVYRIAADGVWDVVWDSNDDTPYDAAIGEDGAVIIGTGATGKIFRVTDEPRTTVLLTRSPSQQVTRFAGGPDGQLYYTTANAGTLYRLAPNQALEGTYHSAVHDATTVATWGTARWRAATPGNSSVELYTRSGNTATPGDTWSAWSEPYRLASGSAITSPKARYLQWKAVLRGQGDTPSLSWVTAAYLPRNIAPEVTEITVHDPGRVFQQAFASSDPPIAGLQTENAANGAGARAGGDTPPATLGRQVYRKGLRTFVWTARDQNADHLRFDVLHRAETDSAWRALERGMTGSIFTWDTTSAPDGTYVVRIDASDAVSNAPGAALRGSLDSAPFDVDNSPPTINLEPPQPSGDQSLVPFVVADAQSPVQRVEFTLDAEQWQVVYPLDGIPDSREERFEVSVPSAEVDQLVVRATDAMDNIVTAGMR